LQYVLPHLQPGHG